MHPQPPHILHSKKKKSQRYCFVLAIVLLFFFYHFFKWFVDPQLWNWYHQQRKHNFLLVGGTVKRFVKLESLRMPFEYQMLTPWDMYKWTNENIENKIFLCQWRTLLLIPQSIRTGWLLQKQLMAQEVIIIFDQMVKQNLNYILCQLMRYLLLKILMQAKVVCRYWLSENWSLCGSSLWGSMVPKFHFRD